MSHIDTLQVYEDYKATGLDDIRAKEYTRILENSFITKLNELKDDFASNRLVSVLGALILIVGSACIGQLWNLSMKFERMDSDLQYIMKKLDKLE